MIFYYVVSLFLIFVLMGVSLKVDAGIYFVQIFFWVFGFFGIFSVLYLEYGEVYIIEQFRYSHFNGGAIALVFLFFLHLLGVSLVLFFLRSRLRILKLIRREVAVSRNVWRPIFWIVSVSLLFLLYLNLLLSDLPPLLREGYIDRFMYIESTTLWWALNPLGVVAVPLPILLGWLIYVSPKKTSCFFMVFLYLLYLALIGQKFGGFILGVFLVLLPVASARMVGFDVYKWSRRLFIYGGGVGALALGVVYYHYSNYALSDEYGGPLGLILYRVFGLQGHAFWGGFNYFLNAPFGEFDALGLVDGMHNVMRLISPSIADEMIARGVSFTFGYFVSLLLHLGIFAFPLIVFLGALHALLAYAVVSAVVRRYAVSYFLLVNILVAFNGLISMGSFSYLFNYKILIVVFLLFLIRLCSGFRICNGANRCDGSLGMDGGGCAG